MTPDDVVEAMARGLWDAYAEQHLHPADWPSWGELMAQGHQGMHRVNEFRGYARAAIRAVTERGGLVVEKMPDEYELGRTPEGYAVAVGRNQGLKEVRAAAVEVEP